ncbi:MAG TPA: response regulator transcription factor [Candidatus Binatia bacterium]|nr:response regulator transcription factor [Candidatus Binatia bacterium]
MLNLPTLDARPRVLLADDDLGVLERVAAMLHSRFEVIDKVPDGSLAVEVATNLNPDIIILDVSMPVLNGMSAAREIRRRRLPAKIVFLSLYGDEDYIAEALSVGAQAYVTKARVASDLHVALDLVLRGRMFVSADRVMRKRNMAGKIEIPAWWPYPGHRHVACQYADGGFFFNEMALLVSSVLEAGDAATLIATEDHQHNISEHVKPHLLSAAIAAGRYVTVDAKEILKGCTIGGRLDLGLWASKSRAAMYGTAKSLGSNLFVFGEVAPQPWARGCFSDGLGLEQVVNDVALTDSVFLICAYPKLSEVGEQSEIVEAIWAEHSCVMCCSS